MENNLYIKTLENNATAAAINWAKTGLGFDKMKSGLNEYIEAIGANQAIGMDKEAIKYGRRAGAGRIGINSIHALTRQQEQTLHDKLMEIADELPELRRRAFRR